MSDERKIQEVLACYVRATDGRDGKAQGTVRPIESGYYDTDLRRMAGERKIVRHRVLLDMPMAIPGA
jgi:hypothetical protein